MEHLEQLRHTGLFENRVPRYTSYPPASRFLPAEGKVYQRRWLNVVPHGARLSLYLHIPYCKQICWFCACRTQAADRPGLIDSYLSVLLKEIATVRAELPDLVLLDRLYIGGGTPTMLTPEQMEYLLEGISAAFPKAPGFGCSVEFDTTNISERLITTLIAQGMDRAIIGVQDFDPRIQEAIGRRQTFERTFNAVQALRGAGLRNLDLELLFGLPKQTAASLAGTAQQLLALEPDRVSVCEYSHNPAVAKRQMMIDARTLPAAEDAFNMFQVARRILMTDGYEPIGMDHFVRPGDSLIAARDKGGLRRDFQGYSDTSSYALIGLGASAISRFPQGYVQNASSTGVYASATGAGQLGASKGYGLSGTDHVIGCMIDMMMCRFEINTAEILQKFPAYAKLVEAAIAAISSAFAPFVTVTAAGLVLDPKAQPLARIISNILDGIGSPEPVR